MKIPRCTIWKNCNIVPDGKLMNRCLPHYTSRGSKNWASCNMANWKGPYSHLKSRCKTEKHCKMSNKKTVSKDQVDVNVLHSKMPYIWRFLDTKTRRKIVKLARKPVKEINVVR